MKKYLLFLFLYNVTYANCEFVKWPYQTTQNEVKNISINLELENLRSYFLYEITTAKNQTLAMTLYSSLIRKEESLDHVNFFKLVAHSSDLENDNFHKLKEDEVCKIYKLIPLSN